MPFQFSGAPPALLGKKPSPVNFRSFAQEGSQGGHNNATSSLTPTTSLPASGRRGTFGSFSTFNSPPCFGQTAFGLGSSSAPSLADGTAIARLVSNSSSAMHNLASDSSTTSPRQGNTTAANGNDSPNGTDMDSLLVRALHRAIRSQPAVMGWKEKAADHILSSLARKNDLDVGALATSLRAPGAGKIASFTLPMFELLVESYIASYSTPATSLPPSGEADLLETENQMEESGAAHIVEDSAGWTVPRYHRTIVQLEDAIAAQIRGHLVRHDEGARVLSEYVVNQLFENYDDADLINDIQEGTGYFDRVFIARMLQAFKNAVWQRDADFKLLVMRDKGETEAAGGAGPSNEANSSTASFMVDREPYRSRQENSDEEKAPFRFLDLAPELRNWIYIYQLAPQGFIALGYYDSLYYRYEKYGSEYTTTSRREINILRTCRQVYKEAKSVLYRENTLLLTAKIETFHHGIFAHHHLPETFLSQLASLTMVCNYHSTEYDGSQWLRRACDLRSLQTLTTLKNLRVCIVQREDSKGNNNFLRSLLKDILDRVPADCEVSFESQTVCEIEYTQDIIETQDACRRTSFGSYKEAYEVDGALLAELASTVKHTQGCKNGLKRDFRFPERPTYKSVQELIAAGEVDPRTVLGGGC